MWWWFTKKPKTKEGASAMARRKNAGVEGSGFDYRDAVQVLDGKKKVGGHIVGIHAGGKRVDVRIDQVGHSNHGYTKTYATADVEAAKPAEAEESDET
jgi:hypothetical protein